MMSVCASPVHEDGNMKRVSCEDSFMLPAREQSCMAQTNRVQMSFSAHLNPVRCAVRLRRDPSRLVLELCGELLCQGIELSARGVVERALDGYGVLGEGDVGALLHEGEHALGGAGHP